MSNARRLALSPQCRHRAVQRAGLVLIAKRLRDDGPEVIYPGHEWQMPQGGIDANEDPRPAALRELYEETGVTSVAYLGETPGWMAYDYPPYDGPPHRLAAFRGQRQKWFAFRFTGQDGEIDISVERAADGGDPEFGEWRWERLRTVAGPGGAVPAQGLRGVAKEFCPVRVARSATQPLRLRRRHVALQRIGMSRHRRPRCDWSRHGPA